MLLICWKGSLLYLPLDVQPTHALHAWLLHRYKKGELNAKNVSMIMPAPFSQRHNSYLRNYVNTGKGKILDTSREVSAFLHVPCSKLCTGSEFARDPCHCLNAKAQAAHCCPVPTLHVGHSQGQGISC